ncbi:acyl-CoA dehydrogenase C-terminal domain-containing protein [Pseudomonas sp. NPDC087342]|uniref:acyl-CoA dehydrogenase C-terminal domain-containing protein n=1 Tax=Pseudomonas sp. NPDC087342 TaxID=3364437 RepID=UPI00381911C2
MADYKAPLRDMRFVLNEVFEVAKLWAELPALADTVDAETVEAILEEAGKVTSKSIAPLSRAADEEGCHWADGAVTTPAGFPQAYQTYAEGGWVGVGGDPAYGGMGMPKAVSAQVEEMVNSASLSFGLYPMLTAGACLSINAHASDELKAAYLPNMYAGVWAGSMCLTEPHAGTDLGIIRTKAEPQADGSYKVSGTKIFITGERSYQNAVEYARDRLQSRSPTGAQNKDKVADPIIVHPDVRRMLLTMKASNEGGRAFSTYVAMQLDTAKFSEDATTRKRAEDLVALLTPVAKAFLTDLGLETTVHGQQVFGGHGYIREWGQEQLVRDVRITQIYEGTNGIQALDLVGRKIVGSGGAFYNLFADEIRHFTATASADLAEFTKPLNDAVTTLDELTSWLLDRAKNNPNEIGAASVEYLQVFGYVSYAYMWALMAKAAFGKEAQDDFYASKLGTARFYFARLLPRIHSLSASVKAGSESLFLLDASQF